MNRLKHIPAAGLIATAGTAFAADSGPDANITNLLKSRLAGAPVGDVKATPIDGIYQTTMAGKIAYLSGDGRYVLIGDMIDLQTQVNLTELSRRDVAEAALKDADISNLIVFPADGDVKAVLNVFTDASCPYCKKLHEEVPELQQAGIEVRYFPFARGGSQGPGYDTMRRIWCGKDKLKAMNIAKGTEPGQLPSGNCKEAAFVDEAYVLGNDVGVAGTPALFTSSGRKIEGYVHYSKLIPMLLGGS